MSSCRNHWARSRRVRYPLSLRRLYRRPPSIRRMLLQTAQLQNGPRRFELDVQVKCRYAGSSLLPAQRPRRATAPQVLQKQRIAVALSGVAQGGIPRTASNNAVQRRWSNLEPTFGALRPPSFSVQMQPQAMTNVFGRNGHRVQICASQP